MLKFKVGTLAARIGVHRNTVTNWIKNGRLSASLAAAKQYTISEKKFREFCSQANIPKQLMEKVIRDFSIAAGLKSVKNKEDSLKKEIIGSVMVVGAGIAGIQAALDLAVSGYYVYLIEKTAGIGGTMAQLDKTFPTNDCASCIVLPKLVECGRHLNIELITLARVKKVEGRSGNFSIQIKKQPRFVDADKCIACGACALKCPINVPDPFNYRINNRKAVYIKYDQSVPLKYAIDPDACIYLKHGKCRACEKFCPTGAINFDQAVETISLEVGAVILSPGFKPFDPASHDFYGYRHIRDTVTSLEFERLLSVSGPNKGRLVRPSDRTQPKKIAWLQCVGSRNHNNCGNSYCSNICCMSSVKQSIASLEHIKGSRLERVIFFTDLRSHGKESERYFERAKQQGIKFVRALPHTLEPGKDGTGVRIRYADEAGRVHIDSFDMVVFSIGFEAPEDINSLSKLFKIELDRHRFARTSCFDPVRTSRPGIFVAGAFQSPVAISRSVVQAGAAAAEVSILLAEKKGTMTKEKDYPKERRIDGQAPCVGVFVCSCGINIAGVVDVEQVVTYAAGLSHVDYVENNLFSCSEDAQQSIMNRINAFGLNRIVIAACTPRTHEPMFQETLKAARLNGFMVEMANIRNQNSWVHQKDSKSATQKAKDQVRMAVSKVIHHYPLNRVTINVNPTALVVGGGMVGMTTALSIAEQGITTILIEKSSVLGGNAIKLDTCFKGEPVADHLEELIHKVTRHSEIRVYTNAVLESASGSVGNFTGRIRTLKNTVQIGFGAAVMAIGAKEAVPTEYLYGKNPRVLAQTQFDEVVLFDDKKAKSVSSVVFIQCVGSREKERMYCSRVCCIHSVKAAISLKKINPDMQVFILYREMRTYGEWEAYYKESRDLGVVFIRYQLGKKPVLEEKDRKLSVKIYDPVAGCPVKILADYAVLATGVVARNDSGLADMFKFAVNSDGFFNGAHPKLKPVDLSVAGLFLAGLCNYPKPMDESIEEAKASACRISMLLSGERIASDAIKAFVTQKCDGCSLCMDVCPFHAISLPVEGQGSRGLSNPAVVIDPALCQGCGICAATCHKGGIMVHGYTMDQLKAQVRAAVNFFEDEGCSL